MRRRRAESGNSASRNAISLKSPSNRAEASMRPGSSTFLAAPSAVNATCPGEEMSSPAFPMSPSVPAAVSARLTIRPSSTGGISAG